MARRGERWERLALRWREVRVHTREREGEGVLEGAAEHSTASLHEPPAVSVAPLLPCLLLLLCAVRLPCRWPLVDSSSSSNSRNSRQRQTQQGKGKATEERDKGAREQERRSTVGCGDHCE
jgi:hypothetical protein